MTKKIIIATGGTGGHVFPAYSLANYLIKKNFSVKLTTDGRGLRYLKNYRNLDLIKIPASPLKKDNILKIIFSILINFFSFLNHLIFLLNNRPAIIFGMGGYSSFPVCIAASVLKIKFVIYENNLIIGRANKYLLPLAKNIFVSYKELEGIPIKYNKKIIQIGNLIREELIDKNSKHEKDNYNIVKILVLGGSQAAKIFRRKITANFSKIKTFCNIN